MPAINENELRKQLDKNEIGRLYFLYGAEKHLVKRAAKRLIKKAAGGDFPEFNLNEFQCGAAADKIADAVEALPLMAERKCVAVSDWDIEEKDKIEAGKINELIETLPETTTLVFYYPTLNFDVKRAAKWRGFLKNIEKTGQTVEFRLRDKTDLRRILMKDAERAGCVLSKDNAALLIEYAGQELKVLLNENAKLCAYAGEGQEITRRMIEESVPKSMETTVFILSNALVDGNYEQAYRCMDTLFYQREEPIAILGALSAAYVDMYRVSAAVKSGRPAAAPAEYGEYRGKEFRLSKAERSVRGVPVSSLRKSLSILLETDVALKSSRADAHILMDTLIAKLLMAAKGDETA